MENFLEGFVFLNVCNILFFFFTGWAGYNKKKKNLNTRIAERP